ncbi:MAG: transglutaminase family protein [Bryobacterales bacterium]|nr:transglutaminase family protein [Bryobacterales bacterium]
MSIRVALHHQTTYEYDRLVGLSPQIVRLRPAPHARTPILSYSLKVEPKTHFLNWQQDPQGNFLARFVFPEKTTRFQVTVDLLAEMTVINPFDFFLDEAAETFPFRYEDWLTSELRPFLERAEPGPLLSAFIDSIDRSETHTTNFLVNLNQRVQKEIRYLIRMEPGVQSAEQTLSLRSGSCRDTGWLLVQVLRNLGLAARFVSGYLIQLVADEKPLDGPAGPSADFTDLHAWCEVYLPGAGWVGLDPTSGLFAGEGHIPLAASPEPLSAAPITGSVDMCETSFAHEMKVTRIVESPRVTKPYTDDQWAQILDCGDKVDEELRAGDVRLTMGGEPTFVSIDDMDGEEWNTAAMGPDKRRIAGDLIARLRNRFAQGALLHYGQGKWYPGESLPRWALTCYWRADGVPMWNDPQLAAEPGRNYGFGAAEAQRFAEELAARLGVRGDYVITAFEDPLTHIHKERQLPINVNPVDNKLNDPEERERMRRVFERGIETPAGFVLPLQRIWRPNGPAWQTGLWMLRSRHLYLLPGDSPIGLRLPLPSLPWATEGEQPQVWTVDPMTNLPPLPVPQRTHRALSAAARGKRQIVTEQRLGKPVPGPGGPWRFGDSVSIEGSVEASDLEGTEPERTERIPRMGESANWVMRTALAVEPREGRLHVFMPPVASTEDYVELLAIIEDTAGALDMPVMIEGYTPPPDSRIKQFKVTPDPGVIEVNVQPAASWPELVHNTTALYEEARQSRLGTEKFMLDGRHSGTGGGNHLVLGGPTPADSPFLRRPDVLRSLIGYWLNHPSLSYLFSGLFVGPTSQAPRVDETRADSVYELEIAFRMIPEPGNGSVPPWTIDRILRNLLVDVTGNTHRAEFCIDKLYSPDTSSGRLGLLEMRAFEMPPHSRMSLTQQLLLRTLVAWFWKQPYRARLTHWGTRLHDQFLLPHFVQSDFRDVIGDLRHAGYGIDLAWFAPHLEFRFPAIGRVEYDGVGIELRTAIEPWYVLGEEPAGGGTARYVDSSVERVQVRITGVHGERYVVACNGRRIPLIPAGAAGEYVAGVRYRAWWPPRCLHPTVPVHTPLIFDVIDTWSGRSIGGCTYHVAHPGGRHYETFPVNANEAEARRAARFFPFGHTPGPILVPPREENPQFPCTLDLRRGR